MPSRSEGPTSASADTAVDSSEKTLELDEDTLELELTEDQALALSRAAAAALRADEPKDLIPVAPAAAGAAPPDEPKSLVPIVADEWNLAFRPTARIELVCNVTLAMLAVGFAIAFLWPRSDARPTAPIVAVATPVAEPGGPPAEPPKPQGPPVRITNAFDRTEVFEFPYGTSEAEAREAVQEALLSRARERGAASLALRRAKTRLPDGGPPTPDSRLFVTKVAAPTKVPLNGTN